MSGRGFFRPRIVFAAPDRQTAAARAGAEGRAERFRSAILPHMDAAYSFARYLTRDPPAAEDIVQDAFLRAFRGFDGWRGDNPKAWLLAIVRNCYLDTLVARRDPLRGAEPVEAIDECASARAATDRLEEIAVARDDAELLRRAIEGLPEPFRETLILRELEELSYKEIAAIT